MDELDLSPSLNLLRPSLRGGRGKRANLIGRHYDRLVVLEHAGSDKHGASLWLCQCSCGNQKVIPRGYLVRHRVKSCGCALTEYQKREKPGFESYQPL